MTEVPRSIHERITGGRHDTGDGRSDFAPRDDVGSARRRPILGLLCAGAAMGLIVLAGFSLYQFPAFTDAIAQAVAGKETQPSATPASPSTDDPFSTHADQVGAKACAATYEGLGKALTAGTQFAVQTQSARTEANQHAVQGVVGMAFGAGKDGTYSGPAAGVIFAAPTAGGCEGTMIRVVPFSQDCQAAVSLLPAGSQQQQSLSGLLVYGLATGGQAMLMPSGTGCVAISIVRSGA